MLVGSGTYTYELVEGWAKLPQDWSFQDVAGLAVDSGDRVYVFNRSSHPVMIFDRNGNFLGSWGEGQFGRPHGSRFDRKGLLWCADDGNHTVSKFTPDGKLLQVIGQKGQPSDTGYAPREGPKGNPSMATMNAILFENLKTIKRGGPPFNRPTGIDFDSSGNIYVSDGYGNARVHRFSPEGKLLFSWGEPGGGPGEFRIPHNVWVDKLDRVWIPDRENNRIQIFDGSGKFLKQWANLARPTDVVIDENDIVYISEIERGVSIFTFDGKLLTSWGKERNNPATDLFFAPHVLTIDSKGDIYVGEVGKHDKESHPVQKFARRK